MKKLSMLFILFLTCFINQSFAAHPPEILLRNVLASANKVMVAGIIRVLPEQITINQDGIFINLDGRFLSVESLSSDEGGLYCWFDEGDDDGDELWECSYCHILNKMSRKECKSCGTWR